MGCGHLWLVDPRPRKIILLPQVLASEDLWPGSFLEGGHLSRLGVECLLDGSVCADGPS